MTQNFLQMIGRAEGRDIVQLGTRPDGQLARWSLADITDDHSSGAANLGGCGRDMARQYRFTARAGGVTFLTDRPPPAPSFSRASESRRVRGGQRMRNRTMTGTDKVICQAAALLLLFTLTSMPAKRNSRASGAEAGAKT